LGSQETETGITQRHLKRTSRLDQHRFHCRCGGNPRMSGNMPPYC
jgi:hypothetical protein